MILRLFLLAFCVSGWSSTLLAADPAKLPNIVYILADDMGTGDVSALNPESKIATPNIDRLASAGMRFTDAHSGSSVCTPTRYGVLTGRYSWRTRLKRGVFNGYSEHLIESDRTTVASLLKQQGYNTACIGKWHLGMDMPTTDDEKPSEKNIDWTGTIKNGPNSVGFDYFYGISASLDMHPYIYIENDQFVGVCTTEKDFYHNRVGPAHEDFEAIDVLPEISRKTVEFINQQSADKPFFAYVPLNSPHTPIVPTEAFQGKSGLGEYGDFCLQTDAVVGEICAALEKQGFSENTLVIFACDNGCSPEADFPKLAEQGHDPSYLYRGHKADIFEGGHRIPFIARWPSRIKPASSSKQTICLTDLLATCAAIVGKTLPVDAGEDSCNILPLLLGEDVPGPLREATVHHSIKGSFAIRQGKWKLALCPGSGGWSAPKPKDAKDLPPVQLYDLETDIGETINLQAAHPDVVARLTALLEDYKQSGRSITLATTEKSKQVQGAAKPNVLFIAVDDLRPELACYGRTHIKSPNIDKLAASGFVFERAYCMVPTCGASRASLMTGLRPTRGRFVSFQASAEKEAPGITTLNTHFQNHGYHTVSNGKVFHLADDNAAGWSEDVWKPTDSGLSYRLKKNQKIAKKKTKKRGPPVEAADVPELQYPDAQIAAKAIDDLRRLKNREEPFFLAVGFYKPHLPFVAPKKYWDLYDHENIRLPQNYFPPKEAPSEAVHNSGELRSYAGVPAKGPVSDEMARDLIHGYYACVSFTDAQVGKVLDELDRLGLAENTIVVLWGDHGWNLAEHTMWCKHSCFETSMHAPLIVRAPGVARAGQRTDALTEFIDIFPSLCDLAGLPLPDHLQGESFVPVLKNPSWVGKPAAIGRFKAGDTIRTDRYRFSEYTNSSGEHSSRMLYDHQRDPEENKNISERKRRAKVVKRLTAKLHSGIGKDEQ